MAQPTPYDRQANFSNEESLNPTGKTPGALLDAEFNAAKVSLDQTQANLALIQRDDGALANQSVGYDQLSSALSIGFTLQGAWAAPENYLRGDGVTYNNAFYGALSSHLSAIGQTPDIRTDLWQKLVDFNLFAPAVLADGQVTTAKLADGFLAANVAGLAKMADGFLAATTAARAKMADKFVTLAKMDDIATASILGRKTAGTGVPEVLSGADVRDSILPAGCIVDRQYAEYTANTDLTTQIPLDDTIPQSTEGTQILSVTITPKSVTNRLRVRFQGWGSSSAAAVVIVAAAFHGASASAYRAAAVATAAANFYANVPLEYEFVPGSTSSLTIAIRVGSNQTIRFNGTTTTRLLGGAGAATLVVEEIKA